MSLGPPPPAASDAPPQMPPPAAQPEYCTHCGTPEAIDQRFCPGCGKPAGASRSRVSHKTLVIVGVVAVSAVLLGGVATAGGVLFLKTRRETITGTMTLTDIEYRYAKEGSFCSGTGGYNDIKSGTSVTLYNGNDDILATTNLHSGFHTEDGCEFSFEFSKVERADFYSVSVGGGRRGKMSFSYDELAADGWNVALTLG